MPREQIQAWKRRFIRATATIKTIGLFVLILIILLFVWRLTPLLLAPFGFITGISHFQLPDLSEICIGPRFFYKYTPSSLFAFTLLILWIFVIIWVYRDAERRGMNGILWALLVFIGNLIGLLIYLIVRTDTFPEQRSTETLQTCSNCQETVAPTFVFCPNCGVRLHTECPGCKKPIEEEWQVCPHCGIKLKK